MSHQEPIDRGVGEDGLNSRVKEAYVYNVPVVQLIHTEVSIPARFPCLYSERITEIPHLALVDIEVRLQGLQPPTPLSNFKNKRE